MSQHIWFCCSQCGRYITGCLPRCVAEHRVEAVESCAICARKVADAE